MKSIEKGDLVLSRAGRDKGEIFLVVKTESDYALIVNGRTRKVLAPKKKNKKHLTPSVPSFSTKNLGYLRFKTFWNIFLSVMLTEAGFIR